MILFNLLALVLLLLLGLLGLIIITVAYLLKARTVEA
jgi:hypothetical protein